MLICCSTVQAVGQSLGLMGRLEMIFFCLEVAVFQLLEHLPRLLGFQHLGMAGGTTFGPENKAAGFGGNL